MAYQDLTVEQIEFLEYREQRLGRVCFTNPEMAAATFCVMRNPIYPRTQVSAEVTCVICIESMFHYSQREEWVDLLGDFPSVIESWR